MKANTFTTGEVQLSYCHLLKPDTPPGSMTPSYSVVALISKNDVATITAYKAAEQDALAYGIREKWGGVQPPVLQGGLKDGDGVRSDGTPYGPECKGCYVLTCKTSVEYPPEIVDQNLQPVIDPRKVYSGCYGRVNVTLIPYNNQSKGIKAVLNCVQILRDGEPLGAGAITAAEAIWLSRSGYPPGCSGSTCLSAGSYRIWGRYPPGRSGSTCLSAGPPPAIDPITGQPINPGAPIMGV